jgi:hypothetical protein
MLHQVIKASPARSAFLAGKPDGLLSFSQTESTEADEKDCACPDIPTTLDYLSL